MQFSIILIPSNFSNIINYSNNFSEAIETRHALHGIRWPTSNPKNLNVDFGTETLMEKAIASTADEVKPSVSSRDDRIASSIDLNEPGRDKVFFQQFSLFLEFNFQLEK